METLSSNIPDKLAGIQVLAVNRMDGLKLILKDRGWLLIRPSGTEPLLRIYGESAREELLKGILEQGKNLISEALSQRGR